jgi:hypothetical protein
MWYAPNVPAVSWSCLRMFAMQMSPRNNSEMLRITLKHVENMSMSIDSDMLRNASKHCGIGCWFLVCVCLFVACCLWVFGFGFVVVGIWVLVIGCWHLVCNSLLLSA